MAKDTSDIATLLAELGRVTVEIRAAKVKQVWESRRYERAGQADLVSRGFQIEGAGDQRSGTFLLTCEIEGEDAVNAAADALVKDRGVSLRGQLVVKPKRDREGRAVPTAKVLVSEVRREW